MKSIDTDAKHMIKTYIDSIEEYFRNHTRLHPNEVDGLLNEINDFIYLRSTEISSDPEKVHYSDVLKAIEECGSPSEICEQYLERGQMDSGSQAMTKNDKINSQKNEKNHLIQTIRIQNHQGKPTSSSTENQLSTKGSQVYDRAYSLYHNSSTFTLYRLCFTLILSCLLLHLVQYPFYSDYSWSWKIFSFYFCLFITLIIAILVIWEGIMIGRWKDRLFNESQLDRSLDDSLISWLFRFSFLLIFLKCSLLDFSVYIFFIPIWFVVFIFSEKKIGSRFWKEVLSPKLISIGKQLSSSETPPLHSDYRSPSILEQIKPYLYWEEGTISIILLILLGMTFFQPLDLIYWGSFGYDFWTAFVIIAITSPLLLTIYRKSKESPFIGSSGYEFYYGRLGIILWLIRLLAIKAILIQTTYSYLSYSPVFILLIILLILLITSEVIFESYGGEFLKLCISRIFIAFGSPTTISISKKYNRINSVDINKRQISDHQIQSTPSTTISKNEEIMDSRNLTSISPNKNVSGILEKKTASNVQLYPMKREPSILSKLVIKFLSIVLLIFKVFLMACTMLLISVYEVVLAFIIIVTGYSVDGSYQVPLFQFNNPDYLGELLGYWDFIELGGFTLWSWYALFLLGIQIFFVSMLQFYGLATKKQEGIVAKVGRNLSRIFIGLLIVTTLIQATYDDPYAILRLMVIAFLLIFNELTAWKIHSERKRWVSPIVESMSTTNQNNENIPAQIKSS